MSIKPPPEPECGNCRFWHGDHGAPRPDATKGTVFVGDCRLNPPVAVRQAGGGDVFRRPRMAAQDWCGQYQRA